MLRHTLYIAVIYFAGIVVTLGMSLNQYFNDQINSDNAALWIILPLFWMFAYYPLVGVFVFISKSRAVMRTLQTMQEQTKQRKLTTPEEQQQLEDYFVTLAAKENGLPEFLLRKLVKKAIAKMIKESFVTKY